MNWTIPGTTLEGLRSDADRTDGLFHSMFLAGGLTLSQVAAVTGLEPYTIQNWVKRGYLTPPRNKRYEMEQVCRIINIHMLKGALSLEQVCRLMTYINGSLSDESDDIIDDTVLYFMFVRLAARARTLDNSEDWNRALDEVMRGYQEPFPGAKEKIIQILRIMVTAWLATRMRQEAERMFARLP